MIHQFTPSRDPAALRAAAEGRNIKIGDVVSIGAEQSADDPARRF
jgi:hypothetical protein